MIPLECLAADKCYFSQSRHEFKKRLQREKRWAHFVLVEEVKPNGDIVVSESKWKARKLNDCNRNHERHT